SLQIIQQAEQRLINHAAELEHQRGRAAFIHRVGHADRIREQQPDERGRKNGRHQRDSCRQADADARRAHRKKILPYRRGSSGTGSPRPACVSCGPTSAASATMAVASLAGSRCADATWRVSSTLTFDTLAANVSK